MLWLRISFFMDVVAKFSSSEEVDVIVKDRAAGNLQGQAFIDRVLELADKLGIAGYSEPVIIQHFWESARVRGWVSEAPASNQTRYTITTPEYT